MQDKHVFYFLSVTFGYFPVPESLVADHATLFQSGFGFYLFFHLNTGAHGIFLCTFYLIFFFRYKLALLYPVRVGNNLAFKNLTHQKLQLFW